MQFESITGDFAQATLNLPNPLDKRITTVEPTITLIQPEGKAATGVPRNVRYDIVIPPPTMKKLRDEMRKPAADRKKIMVRGSVMWGAGGDNISIYGLKWFFKDAPDTILICAEGFEDKGNNNEEPKNAGFHKIYLARLVAELKRTIANVDFDLLDIRFSILSGYSTGFGGLGQSVNNDFFDLRFVERIILFDCIYRADGPALPRGEKPPPLPPQEANDSADEVDKNGHRGSAFNTRRAIIRIQKAQQQLLDTNTSEQQQIEKEKKEAEKMPSGPDKVKKLKELEEKLTKKADAVKKIVAQKVKVIGYAVSSGGSPKYSEVKKGGYPYTVFVDTLIDLREQDLRTALFVLSLTRTLDAAVRNRQIPQADVPASYLQFIPALQPRGEIRSGDAAKKGTLKTLKEWGVANKMKVEWVKASGSDITAAVQIISSKGLYYSTGYPSTSNAGGMLHIGHLVDFG
ncbi:MAG: hypothetical protein ABW036_06090, partial [Flavitalea sp.]